MDRQSIANSSMDLVSNSSMNLVSDSAMDLDSLINDRNIIAPKGWTKEKWVMEYEMMWVNSNSSLNKMIREYELGTARPIMSYDRYADDIGTLFQAGTKYYLWKPDTEDIWEIITSMSLKDLITQIDQQGLDSLKAVQEPDWYWSKIVGKKGDRKKVMKPGVKTDRTPSRKSSKKSNRKRAENLGRKK